MVQGQVCFSACCWQDKQQCNLMNYMNCLLCDLRVIKDFKKKKSHLSWESHLSVLECRVMPPINYHWQTTMLIYIFFFLPTIFVVSEKPAGSSHLVFSMLRIFSVVAKLGVRPFTWLPSFYHPFYQFYLPVLPISSTFHWCHFYTQGRGWAHNSHNITSQ